MRLFSATLGSMALGAGLSLAPGIQAQPPDTGLGAAFPQTANLSQDPAWRVYALQRDGVRYYQLNDPSGVVHAAFAIADGVVLVLPLGVDADKVSVASPNSVSQTPGIVVYTNPQLSLDVASRPDGRIQTIRVHPQATAIHQDTVKSKTFVNLRACGGICSTQIQIQ